MRRRSKALEKLTTEFEPKEGAHQGPFISVVNVVLVGAVGLACLQLPMQIVYAFGSLGRGGLQK